MARIDAVERARIIDKLKGVYGNIAVLPTSYATDPPLPKEVVIPECLLGLVGHVSVNDVSQSYEGHWCYSIRWYAGKGWTVDWHEDTGKAAGQECSFRYRYYYLHAEDNALSWLVDDEGGATLFARKEDAIAALEQIISTAGWSPLEMCGQSVKMMLWLEVRVRHHYCIVEQDGDKWIVTGQFQSPFDYLLCQKSEGVYRFVDNDPPYDDDSRATRFASMEEAVEALRTAYKNLLLVA